NWRIAGRVLDGAFSSWRFAAGEASGGFARPGSSGAAEHSRGMMKQVEQRHVTAPEREFVGVQSYRRDEAIGGSEVERAREPRAIVALVAAGVGGSQLEAWVAHANDNAGLALVLLATSGGQAAQLARQLR